MTKYYITHSLLTNVDVNQHSNKYGKPGFRTMSSQVDSRSLASRMSARVVLISGWKCLSRPPDPDSLTLEVIVGLPELDNRKFNRQMTSQGLL